MNSADSITDLSDDELLAEFKRRVSKSDSLEQKALKSLTGSGVRPALKQVLSDEEIEFSPWSIDFFLDTLRSRHTDSRSVFRISHPQFNFNEVEKALRASPEKMRDLIRLENAGGEPHVVSIERGEFVFEARIPNKPKIDNDNVSFNKHDSWAGLLEDDWDYAPAFTEKQLRVKRI